MGYKYILSLPERAVRSAAALSAGLLREIGEVALPAALRRTMLYRTMVDVTLRFLIEEVGQMEGVYPPQGRIAEHFIARRAASHGIELLGILAFHASPVWVLAALADLTGSGQKLIHEISQALKKEGLLDESVEFQSMDQVLGGLEMSSGHLAQTLNMPPIDVRSLRREWAKLKEELSGIPPNRVPRLDRLERTWAGLRETAKSQGRSVFTVSSLMALSSISHVPQNLLWLSRAARSATRRTGEVLGDSLLKHYAEALEEISQTGVVAYWMREFRPYLRAAAELFSPGTPTLTERLLKRL